MTAEPTPRSEVVEVLCKKLDGAYSTVFERSLAKEAAKMLRALNFLLETTAMLTRRAEMAEVAEQDLERELSLAQSRLAEVEKDAARYRWLRNDSEKHFVPAPTCTMRSGVGIKVIYDYPTVKVPCTAMLDGENLDAAIDEAIKRSSESSQS